MKLDILAAFNTNSRRLIRICRSWRLIPSRNSKQGVEILIIYLLLLLFVYFPFYYIFCEKVQIQKIVILAEFCFNLSPVRRRWNEIRYPRGF